MIRVVFNVKTANSLIKRIKKNSGKNRFYVDKAEGSHMFFRHTDGRTTVVPNHPSEDIDRGLLNKIIKKDLRIQREEFMKHL